MPLSQPQRTVHIWRLWEWVRCHIFNLHDNLWFNFGNLFFSKLFVLRENKTSGEWQQQELCMGDDSVCTGEVVGTQRVKNILSFGEDEDGELYILATAFASPTSPQGVVRSE